MRKGESTKELILAEAAALFNTRGYRGSTLADIMNATGLEKGGIYNHFKNKEEIMVAAFEYAIRTAGESIRRRVEAKDTTREKLKAFVQFFCELNRRPPIAGGCPLLNTAVEADDADPALKQAASKAMTKLIGYITALIEEGIASREFKRAPDPKQTAMRIVASVEGALMMSKLTDDDLPLKCVVEHLSDEINAW